MLSACYKKGDTDPNKDSGRGLVRSGDERRRGRRMASCCTGILANQVGLSVNSCIFISEYSTKIYQLRNTLNYAVDDLVFLSICMTLDSLLNIFRRRLFDTKLNAISNISSTSNPASQLDGPTPPDYLDEPPPHYLPETSIPEFRPQYLLKT